MNLHKLLYPTDFSDSNNAAFHYAQSLAAESGAVLYIAHVDELLDANSEAAATDYLYTTALGGKDRREVRERLRSIRPTLDGVVYKHRYLRGSPVAEILRFSQREEIDLIVMGSHGRRGLSRLLMGSVAEGVTRKAPCPVLIVKQPPTATHDELQTQSAQFVSPAAESTISVGCG
jgi:universal stress protein A